MYINHVYVIYTGKILSLLLVNCTVTFYEKKYFLIPTLLSVKLKSIYLFEGLLFYNEKYLF